MKRLWLPMFKVSEGLPKPKDPRATKWTKHDGERIELSVAAEVMER
jgi:hypothetical protein